MAEERTFDGLDEVILAELEKEVGNNNQKISKDRDIVKKLEESLATVKQ
jgi:hypothetical protein